MTYYPELSNIMGFEGYINGVVETTTIGLREKVSIKTDEHCREDVGYGILLDRQRAGSQ